MKVRVLAGVPLVPGVGQAALAPVRVPPVRVPPVRVPLDLVVGQVQVAIQVAPILRFVCQGPLIRR